MKGYSFFSVPFELVEDVYDGGVSLVDSGRVGSYGVGRMLDVSDVIFHFFEDL
jgi:hypothetical protein